MATFVQLVKEGYIDLFPRGGGYSLYLKKEHPQLTTKNIIVLADTYFLDQGMSRIPLVYKAGSIFSFKTTTVTQ